MAEKHNDPFILCRYCMPRLLAGWAALCGVAALVWWWIA